MFRPYNQTQPFFFPPVLDELIPNDHPAHMVNDLVEKLDLTVLLNRYGNMGQPAYLPKLMLKVILYGFSVGIFSARKLSRACQENLAFKYNYADFSQIKRMELGKVNFSISYLKLIAEKLEVPAADLLNFEK